ncbi:hypothetical protein ED733_007355 [Metarhizium rileyi]|uniref:Heterokaryon incompatibility domain-containing protein n=1 Tax=Metarhizium rileyi (strain RCEF 4871) TaxID=1649241 RepID=A0A5C6GPA0_METRR|nr:hypothetical protein ED733_007355 [Metarhizium rileyi]
MPFEALSYTWGDPIFTETIFLDKGRLDITNNLYLALQYLRRKDRDRILWIDAICIDQKNFAERGHQVQHMGELYASADTVICWLGTATYETKVIMDSLRLLHKKSIQYASGGWNTSNWTDLWSSIQPALARNHSQLLARQQTGLEILLKADWFKRVWIIQEVANAKSAQVQCGNQAVSTNVFGLAPELLSIPVEPHCKAVLDVMPGPLRRSSWWNESRDLYSLLKHFRSSEALDPRDLVFALLGISSDMQPTAHIMADYTKTIEDVTRELSQYLYHVKEFQSSSIQEFLRNLEPYNITALRRLASSQGELRHILASIRRILQRKEDARISETVVEAAASNVRHGREIMDYLCQHANIHLSITENVAAVAAANKKQGMDILLLLFQHAKTEIPITERVVKAAIRNSMQIMELLLQHTRTDFPITENVVKAATMNRTWGGYEALAFLFQISRKEIPITKELVIAGALHRNWASHVVPLLLQHAKTEIPMTKELLESAAKNKNLAKEVMVLLLELGEVPVAEDVVDSMMRFLRKELTPSSANEQDITTSKKTALDLISRLGGRYFLEELLESPRRPLVRKRRAGE